MCVDISIVKSVILFTFVYVNVQTRVEYLPCKRGVPGTNPSLAAHFFSPCDFWRPMYCDIMYIVFYSVLYLYLMQIFALLPYK